VIFSQYTTQRRKRKDLRNVLSFSAGSCYTSIRNYPIRNYPKRRYAYETTAAPDGAAERGGWTRCPAPPGRSGAGGISRDAITKEARSYHPSAVGTISEATKDSSSVGISTYLTAAPKLTNVLGIKTPDAKDNGIAGKLSTSALLAPFVETEASKRAGFISIQNGHVAPIDNAEIPYIRTLEELAIAYRVGKPFTLMAEEDGEVTKLAKNLIEVTYLSGKKDSMEIGVWSTRPESNKAFKHLNVTDLKLGDKFSKNDPIA
jgi:hypothetical protein